eukprot:18647-Eustigmatos_ZCMA.PRE.1
MRGRQQDMRGPSQEMDSHRRAENQMCSDWDNVGRLLTRQSHEPRESGGSLPLSMADTYRHVTL